MPSIKKKNTTELKHIAVSTIKNTQVVEDANGNDLPIVSFVMPNNDQAVMPLTPRSWERVALGIGATLPALSNGLADASRYRFQLLVDNLPNESSEKVDTVVGVHCIPNDNYIRCDFGATLNRPNITKDMAVIQVYEDTGEIDIIAFPEDLRRNVNSFLKTLEGISEFDNTTSFTADGITYSIVNAFGTELSFRCSKRR